MTENEFIHWCIAMVAGVFFGWVAGAGWARVEFRKKGGWPLLVIGLIGATLAVLWGWGVL